MAANPRPVPKPVLRQRLLCPSFLPLFHCSRALGHSLPILFWSATVPRSDCPHHNPIRSAHRESNPYQANSIHSFDSPFLSVGPTVCLTFRPFGLTLCAGSLRT